ncbi:hypothetical protein C2W64_04368 [Brevibacillus laterosporus]|nr:hypothetical protein C2W64_04368 [Brevibacillus laterosporus]
MNGNPVGFIDPLWLAGLGTGQCQKGKAEGTGETEKYYRTMSQEPL